MQQFIPLAREDVCDNRDPFCSVKRWHEPTCSRALRWLLANVTGIVPGSAGVGSVGLRLCVWKDVQVMLLQSLCRLSVTISAAASLLLPSPAYLCCTDLVSQVTGRVPSQHVWDTYGAHNTASLTQEVQT